MTAGRKQKHLIFRPSFALLAAALLLAACGAKGDLECPSGTAPQDDGTCRPEPAK